MHKNEDSPRLLILGSMDEFCLLVKRARERGCQAIVADGYADGPARAFADESYVVDIRDRDAMVRLCREQRIDLLVASFSDILFESGCLAAHDTGLPATCSLNALDRLRDKDLMKRMFDELGIPHSSSKTVSTNGTAIDLEGLRFPCVVKPLNGYGSYDICVAENSEDACAFMRHMENQGYDQALVEEYDAGHEFNMMCWVANGQAHILSIADREKTWRGSGEVPHVSRIVYPSCFSSEVIDEASRHAQSIADHLGLVNSPLCIQFFWSPGESVRVCEAAGRIFGYEHELLEYASGLAVEDLLLDLALGEDTGLRLKGHDPLAFPTCCCGVYFHTRGGAPVNLKDAPQAFDAAGAREWICYYGEHDVMSEGKGGKPYVARAYLQAPSRDLLDEATREVFASFSVRDAEERELILPNELPS
ncbi:MAG: ATP-grasp domain-containing protein [Gordonibacter sp.]|uniref:ATP-grasp domain-containing protein n=1 Tax=Gordonibacter sp. TaxID=1968902 RepID=UPI002FC8B8E0